MSGESRERERTTDLREIVRSELADHPQAGQDLFLLDDIPAKRLAGVYGSLLAAERGAESVLVLLDWSTWGNGKRGLAITPGRTAWRGLLSGPTLVPHHPDLQMVVRAGESDAGGDAASSTVLALGEHEVEVGDRALAEALARVIRAACDAAPDRESAAAPEPGSPEHVAVDDVPAEADDSAEPPVVPDGVEAAVAALESGARAVSLAGLADEHWRELARVVSGGKLSLGARERLAAACEGHPPAVCVVEELCVDVGVPVAIVRTALAPSRFERLREILGDHRVTETLRQPGDPGRLLRPLVGVLSDSRTWLWLLRILFSRSVVAALPELVVDRDRPVRVAAVRALGTIPGDRAERALFQALSDAAKEVRQEAVRLLEERCGRERVEQHLAAEVEELNEISSRVEEARGALGEYFGQLPGLGWMAKGVSGMGRAFAAAGRTVARSVTRPFGAKDKAPEGAGVEGKGPEVPTHPGEQDEAAGEASEQESAPDATGAGGKEPQP